METTVYNPQKGRLETIEIDLTNDNTTWFSHYKNNSDVSTITDFNGGILISKFDYTYPFWIYDISRVDIGYNQNKARQLRREYE